MYAWEAARIASKGAGKRFHYLDDGEDVAYLRMLEAWADGAADGGEGVGKEPPRWREREAWVRERVGEIKAAWVGFGAGRKGVRTLEGCGFGFCKWEGKEEMGGDSCQSQHQHERSEKMDDVVDAENGGQAE